MNSSLPTFESFFYDHPDSIILINHSGTILELNKAAEEFLKYKREELIGKQNIEILDFSKVDISIVEMMIKSVFDGANYTADLFAKRSDGASLPIRLLINQIRYQDEDVLAFSMQDLTLRSEVDATLRESEDRYRSLVDFSPFAIFIVVSKKISYLNPAAVSLLRGSSQHEMIGQPMSAFLPMDQQQDLSLCFGDRELDVKHELIETQFLDVSKSKVDVEALCLPIEYKGIPAIQIIALDITKRIFLEEELRQSQKLEAIGLLAGGIAHDFNNILTGIIGYAGLGVGVVTPEHPAHRFFNQIEIKSQEAAKLVHQLLAFSRKDILTFTKLDLNDIIVSSVDFLGRVLPEHIDYNILPIDQECTINADPVAIQQILTNLCVNAKDAMPEGGSIFITTDIVYLEDDILNTGADFEPGYYVKLSVKDMGMGMDSDTLEKIYDPFFTTKGIGHGSGLGLSMAYGLVKQHDGFINCTSKVGEGTTFDIFLPHISEAPLISDVTVDSETIPGGREKILLVEDDVDVLTILHGILESAGYTVKMAKNGRVALDILQDPEPAIDLVITDIIMPEMSGTELFEQAKYLSNCPEFLYISGYARNSEIKGLKLSPDVAFMKKPFTATELNQRIRKIFDGGNEA